MRKSGINLVAIKEYNQALITQLICANQPTTRNFLTKKSMLTSMTLTNITAELIRRDIISEYDYPIKGAVGRNPKVLVVSDSSPVVAGIWMSKDFLFGSICDFSLKLITAKRVDFDAQETDATVLDKLVEMGQYLLSFSHRRIMGIGISCVGVVDSQNGVIRNVTGFFGIKTLDIKSRMEKEFEIPVYVKNDMQSSALCEMYFGIGKRTDNFIYVGITNGIGSAVVSNRQLMNNLGSGGELGHTTINYQGPLCDCGSRGCLEMYASVPNFLKRINLECGSHFVTLRQALAFCETNPPAHAIFDDVCNHLVYALNNLVNIINIDTIVLGHSGVAFPDYALESMKKRISEISVSRNSLKFNIIKTEFEENSPLFGSVCIVLDQIFTGRLPMWTDT